MAVIFIILMQSLIISHRIQNKVSVAEEKHREYMMREIYPLPKLVGDQYSGLPTACNMSDVKLLSLISSRWQVQVVLSMGRIR